MNRLPFILLIFLLTGLAAFPQQKPLPPLDTESVLRKIHETSKNTNTIQSDFIQEKEMNVLAEKIISKGAFYFKKEKQLRWEYTEPFPYLIIINNDQLLVRDENRENRINLQTDRVFREINDIIIGAVQGTLLTDTRNFRVSVFDDRTHYLCKLIPLNARLTGSLSEISIYFNKSDYTVDKLDMRESSGDYTRIRFISKKINLPLADEKFSVR